MKTTLALLATLVITTSAQADHARLRVLDDIAFSAYIQARDVRWEIHDHFNDSRDFLHLLRDADTILAELRDLQDSIYRERSEAWLGRELDTVKRRVDNLRSHMEECDFATHREARRYSVGSQGRFAFAPETRHGGWRHVAAVNRMLDQIDCSLAALRSELTGQPAIAPPPSHHHNSVPPVLTPRDRNVPPAPSQVPPVSHRSSRTPSRGLEIPLFGGKNGFVLRFGD